MTETQRSLESRFASEMPATTPRRSPGGGARQTASEVAGLVEKRTICSCDGGHAPLEEAGHALARVGGGSTLVAGAQASLACSLTSFEPAPGAVQD